MTLISLLLVLVAERVALQSEKWQSDYYLKQYFSAIKNQLSDSTTFWSVFLIALLPAVIIGVVESVFDSVLISFVLSVLLLAVCIGDATSRKKYRQYLNAAERGDIEAQAILRAELQQSDFEDTTVANEEEHINQDNSEHNETENKNNSDETLAETLIWINFKYYAAPIFYFVLLGLPGLAFYITVLQFVELAPKDKINIHARNWLQWLYWVPARLVSLGFMLVGHFTNGLETWLKYATNSGQSSKQMLCKVALESESSVSNDEVENAKRMVKLTKRNMMVFVVVVALLTLYGQIV